MEIQSILRGLAQGGNTSRITPGCGGGLMEYATMAAAGQVPSRFEVGCLVPMQFDIVVPGAGTAVVEQEPRQDVLPVALHADLSGPGIIIDRIVGPDGDPAGLKGDGIGPSWRPAFFSLEALRSYVNPFPRDVGIVTSSKGIAYELTNTGALDEDFVGITYSFIAGTEGIAYMSKCGIIGDDEASWMRKILRWCDTGNPPADLCELGAKIIGSGALPARATRPTGSKVKIGAKVFDEHDDGSYVPVP